MADFTTPVTGPTRFTVTSFAGGSDLDVSEWLGNVLVSIATDEGLLEQFMAIVEDHAAGSGHDGFTPEKLLVERLADQLGRIRLYELQAAKLAAALAPQREAGAA